MTTTNKNKKVISTVILIISFSYCTAQFPFTTPELLAENTFIAIKNNDPLQFKKLIVDADDRDWAVKQDALNKKEIEDYFNYKINLWSGIFKSLIKDLHEEGINKGVDWENAKFDKAEYTVIEKDIAKSDIYIIFNSNNNIYKIKMDDCLRMKRGWVVFDDIIFK